MDDPKSSCPNWGIQGLFADMLFVLSKPIPPLVKTKVVIPPGHRKCAGCGEIRTISCFWQQRTRYKSCLGKNFRASYLGRLSAQNKCLRRMSKFDKPN